MSSWIRITEVAAAGATVLYGRADAEALLPYGRACRAGYRTFAAVVSVLRRASADSPLLRTRRPSARPRRDVRDDWRHGHFGANRALFSHFLPEWVRTTLPEAHQRLLAGGLVADVACGSGYAGIGLARASPAARVHGLDLDAETIELARENAVATSVLHCLPACLAERPSAGTGTVMRVATVQEYARAAGFDGLRLLRAEDRFHRLYHLVG